MFDIYPKHLLYFVICLFFFYYLIYVGNKSILVKQLNILKNKIKFRAIDMGIKFNPCSYEIVKYIDRNKNIKMFNELIRLFIKLNYDIRLPIIILLLKQRFNKPIIYGIKQDNLTNKFGFEFYAYIGDHNTTHDDISQNYKTKIDMLNDLYNILRRLYDVPNFLKSQSLLRLLKNTNIIIISFNIDTNGTFIPKLNIYTEHKIRLKNTKTQIVVITFEYDMLKNSIQFSNIGFPYADKRALAKSPFLAYNKPFFNKFIKNLPNGSRYIVHKKNDKLVNIYVINPKMSDVKMFLIDNNFDLNLVSYINKNNQFKSVDIAYAFDNTSLIRTALYDSF